MTNAAKAAFMLSSVFVSSRLFHLHLISKNLPETCGSDLKLSYLLL
jgi:hypothetical protein